MTIDVNELSARVIGACIEVHRNLGPGLLENAYEEALARELEALGIRYERQPRLGVSYKGAPLDAHYRADFVVEGALVIELKAIDVLLPVHKAQVLTYLRASALTLGLLVNFNVPNLRGSIRRVVNGAPDLTRAPI
jgi:GxxExxY protein